MLHDYIFENASVPMLLTIRLQVAKYSSKALLMTVSLRTSV